MQQRPAGPRRQREGVHVGLEVALVAGVGERRLERVVEPVAGKRHRALEGAWRTEHGDLRTSDEVLPVERRRVLDPRILGRDDGVAARRGDDRARVRAGRALARLAAKGHPDGDRALGGVGEGVQPTAPVGVRVDVHSARDRDALHVNRLRRVKAVHSVELEAEAAHELAVQIRLPSGVDARREVVLDAPIRAVAVDHVVERERRGLGEESSGGEHGEAGDGPRAAIHRPRRGACISSS